MNKTPNAMRKQVTLFGRVNAGKSLLFNKILGQSIAIVSDAQGTTTDPIRKPMELIGYGAITLVDTAGFCDKSYLGDVREKKSMDVISRSDLIIHVIDASEYDEKIINDEKKLLKNAPTIDVITHCDSVGSDRLSDIEKTLNSAVFLTDDSDIEKLKQRIVNELNRQKRDDDSVLGKILEKGSRLILVCPIDSEAPKGRLILPQVQIIRDCLDNDMMAYVTNEKTLADALETQKNPDLVVCDSQVFKMVSHIVPKEIPLTSFSMLLAYQKGNFTQMLDGVRAIDTLGPESKVLMLEGCTHNSSHDDIGRNKIPNLIRKRLGHDIKTFDMYTGYDMPGDISEYDLIIQCGMCMINKKEVENRLALAYEKGVPITNYGMTLAHLSGILNRACEVFKCL